MYIHMYYYLCIAKRQLKLRSIELISGSVLFLYIPQVDFAE